MQVRFIFYTIFMIASESFPNQACWSDISDNQQLLGISYEKLGYDSTLGTLLCDNLGVEKKHLVYKQNLDSLQINKAWLIGKCNHVVVVDSCFNFDDFSNPMIEVITVQNKEKGEYLDFKQQQNEILWIGDQISIWVQRTPNGIVYKRVYIGVLNF